MSTSSPTSSMWVTCFVSIRFDLDIGPRVEHVAPSDALTTEGKQKVIQAAFPDCNPDCAHNFIFSFTMPDCTLAAQESFSETVANPTEGSTLTQLYGAAYYRQKKDVRVPRGYVQQVIVLLSRVPYAAVHELILRVVAPRFAQCCPLSPDTERVAVSSALAPFPSVYFALDPSYVPAHFTQEQVLDEALAEMAAWPTPHPRLRYAVTLLHQALEFVTPSHSGRPPKSQLQHAVRRPPMRLDARTSFLDEYIVHPHGVGVGGAMGGLGGLVSSVQDVLPLYGLLGDQLHYLTHLWELVICHEPLFILSNTPSMASAAALAVASLIAPIEYTGKLYSYFTVQNSEFSRLSRMGKAIPFELDSGLIVAGTNPFFLRNFSGWPNLLVTVDRFTGIGAAGAAAAAAAAATAGSAGTSGASSGFSSHSSRRRSHGLAGHTTLTPDTSTNSLAAAPLHQLPLRLPSQTSSPEPHFAPTSFSSAAASPSGVGGDAPLFPPSHSSSVGGGSAFTRSVTGGGPPKTPAAGGGGVFARLSSVVFTPGTSTTASPQSLSHHGHTQGMALPYGTSLAAAAAAEEEGSVPTASPLTSPSPGHSHFPTAAHAPRLVSVPATTPTPTAAHGGLTSVDGTAVGAAATGGDIHPSRTQDNGLQASTPLPVGGLRWEDISSTHIFVPETESPPSNAPRGGALTENGSTHPHSHVAGQPHPPLPSEAAPSSRISPSAESANEDAWLASMTGYSSSGGRVGGVGEGRTLTPERQRVPLAEQDAMYASDGGAGNAMPASSSFWESGHSFPNRAVHSEREGVEGEPTYRLESSSSSSSSEADILVGTRRAAAAAAVARSVTNRSQPQQSYSGPGALAAGHDGPSDVTHAAPNEGNGQRLMIQVPSFTERSTPLPVSQRRASLGGSPAMTPNAAASFESPTSVVRSGFAGLPHDATAATNGDGCITGTSDPTVNGQNTVASLTTDTPVTTGPGSPAFTRHDYDFLKASAKVAATKKIAKSNPVNSRTKLQHSLMNYFDSSFAFTLDHEEQTAFLMKRLEAVSRMDQEAQSASVSLHVNQYYDAGPSSSRSNTTSRATDGSPSSPSPPPTSQQSVQVKSMAPSTSSASLHADPNRRDGSLPHRSSAPAIPDLETNPYLDTIFAQYTIADDMVRKFFVSLTAEFLSPISVWFHGLVDPLSAFKLCDRAIVSSMLNPASFLEFFYHKHRDVAPRMWTRHHTYKGYKGVYERFANGCLFTTYVRQLVDHKLRKEVERFESDLWAAQFPSEPERIDMYINLYSVVQREVTQSLNPDVLFVTTATAVLAGMAATISDPLRDQFMIKLEELKL